MSTSILSEQEQAAKLVREFTANALAYSADCFSPDGPESPGARFLLSVAESVAEAIESADRWPVDSSDVSDACSEIADSAPDVYTHARWLEFVDLGAYNEDPGSMGGESTNMTDLAGLALYAIAERLAYCLFETAGE